MSLNASWANGGQKGSDSFTKFQDLRVAQDDANFASAIARNAVYTRSPEQFNKFADDAKTKLQEALKLATEVKDATRVEDIGKELAALSNARAGMKDKEATNLDQQAAAQATTLNSLQAQLTQMKEDARSIEVKIELSQAKQALIDLQAQIAAIPESKTVTVTVTTDYKGGTPTVSMDSSSVSTKGSFSDGGGGNFAEGGLITGPGTATSDSILAKLSDGEYIVRAAAVAHYGPSLLQAINQMRLPRFAEGGLAGLRVPSLPASGVSPGNGSNATFNFPGMGSFPAHLAPHVMDDLKSAFAREALKKGGRR